MKSPRSSKNSIKTKLLDPTASPPIFLHHLRNELATPLCWIANISFFSGIHPDKLKIAKIIPIFKSGSKLLPAANYRPVSLLSNINKIMEKIAYSRVFNFLNINKIFYEQQFGFRPLHSTNHSTSLKRSEKLLIEVKLLQVYLLIFKRRLIL